MSTSDVPARLSVLSDSIKSTSTLIKRLAKLEGDGQGLGDTRIDLSQDIHDNLSQYDDAFELLRQEVDDLTSGGGTQRRRESNRDRETSRLEAQVARLGEELKHARSQFRRAQLTAKRAAEAAKQQERELLFARLQQHTNDHDKVDRSSSTDLFAGRRQPQSNKNLTQDEIVANASSDVTSALRRTHDLLTSELSRSRFAQETLDQSTAALADLGDKYSSLDSLLASSKSLLGTLVSSQKSDTWYLETAFYLLVATLCWLVFRRLIYGPAWWFIWLPLRYLIIQPFIFIFTAFGIIGAKSAAANTVARAPLRVQPSATGGIPRFAMSGNQRPGVPVGGGGSGAKVGPDGKAVSRDDTMAERIGQMVEASRLEAEHGLAAQEGNDGVKRADGTVLQPRGDKPRNPKKKMWEEDVEAAKYEAAQRDEL